MTKLNVGYLPLAKGSWLNADLETRRVAGLELLRSLNAEVVDLGKLVASEDDGREALEAFQSERVDCIVARSLTFPLGSIVPKLARELDVPVIFWSEPEPPMTGGRLEKNSFCAVNMNAHALWRMKRNYRHVHGDDDVVKDKLARELNALRCAKKLASTRIGAVGGRVPGFFTSNYDELSLLETFGVQVEVFTLLEVVENARKLLGDAAGEAAADAEGVSADEIAKSNALRDAFVQMADKHALNAFAVRCWPEIGDIYGVAVCAALGELTERGLTAACEGDVLGAVAMIIGETLSSEKPFFCDLIDFDTSNDTAVAWHCGAAAPSLRASGASPKRCPHSIMDGGGVKGVTREFPLKSGPVTLLRLGERRGGGYRMFVRTGEALDTPQLIKGNPSRIKFHQSVEEMTETIVANGLEHHYVLVHGDMTEELKAFNHYFDIEEI